MKTHVYAKEVSYSRCKNPTKIFFSRGPKWNSHSHSKSYILDISVSRTKAKIMEFRSK